MKSYVHRYDKKITGELLNLASISAQKINPEDYCNIQYYSEGCGDGGINEVLEFRPIWFVLLSIENVSSSAVKLDECSGDYYFPNSDLEPRPVINEGGEYHEFKIPIDVLKPGESILIPEYCILAPVKNYKIVKETDLYIDPNTNLKYELSSIRSKQDFYLIGTSFNPKKINIAGRLESIHQFNIENTLSISPYLECGCCPHVFGVTQSGLFYIGSCLIGDWDRIPISEFDRILICELEDELSYFREISLGNNSQSISLLRNILLVKGEYLVINNEKRFEYLYTKGKYLTSGSYINDREKLIMKFNRIRRILWSFEEGNIISPEGQSEFRIHRCRF